MPGAAAARSHLPSPSSHSPDPKKPKRTRDLEEEEESELAARQQRQRRRRQQQPAVAAMAMAMMMLSDEEMELSQLILESGENQAITLAQELHRYLLGKGNKGAGSILGHTRMHIGPGLTRIVLSTSYPPLSRRCKFLWTSAPLETSVAYARGDGDHVASIAHSDLALRSMVSPLAHRQRYLIHATQLLATKLPPSQPSSGTLTP